LHLEPDLTPHVTSVARSLGWNGTMKPIACDTCSENYPCTVQTEEEYKTGFTFSFQIDFNEYYDENCSDTNLYDSLENYPVCEANYDYGMQAYKKWDECCNHVTFKEALVTFFSESLGWSNTQVLGSRDKFYENGFLEWSVTRAPSEYPTTPSTVVPTLSPTASPTRVPTPSLTHTSSALPTGSPTGVPTSSPTLMPTAFPTPTPTLSPTQTPSETPTQTPSETPTQTPSETPTSAPTQTPTGKQCGPYTNNIDDFRILGVAAHCRAGLNMSYPGGLSCDSPYIVCLPQENTPAQFGYEPYYSSTHRYSEEECKQECANDQRCRGFEVSLDLNSTLGNCTLIDDIPVLIEPSQGGKSVICYEKNVTCYPYFEADKLDATMLNCYCPNNRKGFYTKKVKRTVENTRFCGNDTDIDERIRKAQANRMFHLCENWCLFETENPTEEYWFWDPWKTCWREQEAASSYCTHIIEDPLTIEMQFLIDRRKHFCELNGTVYE